MNSEMGANLRKLADDYDGLGRSHPISDAMRQAADRLDKLSSVVKAADRLSMKSNAITAHWRHGNPIPLAALGPLYDAQLETEKALEELKK